MSVVVPHIIKFDSVDSTNSLLKELAQKGANEGTVVVATTQHAGRGRGGRIWHSPEGGLYFSLLLKSYPNRRPTDMALLAGAVMAQTVKHFCPQPCLVGVKWPNDCLLEGKKVGGVLCEAIDHGDSAALIIGVGININTPLSELEPFMGRPFGATSLREGCGGKCFELESILERFLKVFFEHYPKYLEEGFLFLQTLWERECLFIGKNVELRNTGTTEESKDNVGGVRGTFLGIDEQGAIVLSDSCGNRRSYVTGEMTCCW